MKLWDAFFFFLNEEEVYYMLENFCIVGETLSKFSEIIRKGFYTGF